AAYDSKTLACEAVNELRRVKDAHAVCRRGDDLFVTSTGTNEVHRVRVDGPRVVEESVHWRSPDACAYDRDIVHVNSIRLHQSELIVTCFGPRTGDGWGDVGKVINIDTGAILMDRLYQPHDGGMDDEGAFCCDSMTGRFRRANCEPLSLGGYTRGAA